MPHPLCVGIAFVILIMAPSYPVMLVAAVIFGIGFGTFNPAVTMAVAGSAASPKYAALAISVYTCGTGIGQFLSPYILKFIRGIFGMTSARADWQIAAVCLIAGSIISAIVIFAASKKKSDAPQLQ